DTMRKWTEFSNDESKMTEMLRDPKNINESAGEHKRRDDKRFFGKEKEIGTSAKKSRHVKNDVYYTEKAMIEASDIMKFDTRCAPERFGKVVSTFTEEQNEVLYLNSVVYGNIGGDVSKVPVVLWNKKEIKRFIKWLDKHGGFDSKEVVVRDISCTNAVNVQSDGDNNVNRILSAPHLVIKKLDAQAEDIKGLSANIIELTACVESQNKFLYDMMSMIKAWVPSKSHCNWDTFVKKDEKCMVSQRNKQTLEKTEEKYQAVDLNCEVIGIEKKRSELKYKNVDVKHDVFVKVKDNVSKSIPVLNSSTYSIGETDKISQLSKRKYSSRSRTSPFVVSKQSMKLHDNPPTEEKKRDLSKIITTITEMLTYEERWKLLNSKVNWYLPLQFSHNSDDARKTLALELLSARCNILRDLVLDRARSHYHNKEAKYCEFACHRDGATTTKAMYKPRHSGHGRRK
ncbi:hypothetical protein CUMW_158450, partial [Citrus unshiu]